jgi:FkbH-like protein
MTNVNEIVDLLCAQASWKGFPQVRRYLREKRTKAEIRALAEVSTRREISDRSDFPTRLCRIAAVGSRSTENLRDAIAVQCLDRGLFCEQYHAPFGQFSQEIRNANSGLYRFKPDVVVLFPHPSNYLPPNSALNERSAGELIEALWAEISILRDKFDGPILVGNFLAPEARPLGILDGKQDLGVADFCRHANYALSQRLRQQPAVFVLDVAHLSSFGAAPWSTLHKGHYLAGYGIPDQLATHLARDIAAAGAALKGFTCKCLVVDLDNTLWRGIVGEDGVASLQIGGSFPGNVYAALQSQIKALLDRGALLAVNSKNNEEDVRAVFETRKDMILKWADFSCVRVNWTDKVTNLREIAQEMNIGLDSLVVLDDNPAEREWIETACPEVYVIPESDPLEMLRALAVTRLFDSLSVTAEDRQRKGSYAAMAQRNRLRTEKADLDEFLHGLQLTVEIGAPTGAQLGRVAQLTQKTNQFNLTTRRYSEERLQQLPQSGEWEVFYCSCHDRFADEGIVGAAIVHKRGVDWVIDTFLLSCRVLGRGVEQAFLWWICGRAEREGARRVIGEFVRSGKNGQTENFYQANGFCALPADNDCLRHRLDLPLREDRWPAWITDSGSSVRVEKEIAR